MMRALLILLCLTSPGVAETLTVVRVVRPHAVIAPDDFTVSNVIIPGALKGDVDIVGLEAKITLYPGRPIMPSHVGPAAMIERNQPVTLIFRRGGLTIVAEARALSRGAVGEVVRVMNLSSRTTVAGRVMQDGSVVVSPERTGR